MRYPHHVTIEITDYCNQSCDYCYNHCRDNKIKQTPEVTVNDFRKLLRKIKEFNLFSILITGGEPFSRKDLILEVLKFAKTNNISVSINTNLTLLTDSDIDMLEKYSVKGLLISLCSYKKEEHDKVTGTLGSYDKIIENIKKLKKRGIGVSVNMVVTKRNMNDIIKTGLFAKETLGCKSFSATAVLPPINKLDQVMLNKTQIVKVLDSLLELKDKHGLFVDSLEPYLPCMFDDPYKYQQFLSTRRCNLGNTWVMKANGDLHPCGHIQYNTGNILNDSFEEVIESQNKLKIKTNNPESRVPVECLKCAEVESCKGGCRSLPLIMTGNIKSKNPYMGESLTEKLNFKIKLIDLINQKFSEPLEDIKYRKESRGYTCSINGKFARMTDEEFTLLQLIKKEERLFRENINEFMVKYSLDRYNLNLFLNKISRKQANFTPVYQCAVK